MNKRKFLTRLLAILDGTAGEYAPKPSMSKHGLGQHGQSLVEMAFITPLLVILVAGLIEIGWLANNYLNLLDITRYGARFATTLTDESAPLSWDNNSSYLPNEFIPSLYEMGYSSSDPVTITLEQYARTREREQWAPNFDTNPANPSAAPLSSVCASPDAFYSLVVCRMLASMPPMRSSAPFTLNPYNDVDDIIISGFGLQLVDVPSDPAPSNALNRWTDPASRPITDSVPQLLVAARYPLNANECQQAEDGTPNATIMDPRDPFDINANGMVDTRDTSLVSSNPGLYHLNVFNEISGYDAASSVPDQVEKQVGFQWYGNHVIPNTGCIGSEWNLHDVEVLLNVPNYNLNAEQRAMLPNQGVVLVEMYWEHTMLLQFPVLSPVYEAMSQDGTPDLYLWAMFPLPSVSPFITYAP